MKTDFRESTIADLGTRAARSLRTIIPVLAILLAGATAYQISVGRPGAYALGLTSLGSIVALMIWRKQAQGLPLLPMIVIQHLVVYAVPLLVTQDTLAGYSADYFTKAGIELLIFLVTMAAAWRSGMTLFKLAPPVCYGLKDLVSGGGKKLVGIGFALTLAAFVYQLADHLGALDAILSLLPSGLNAVVWALISAAGACGFFILSLMIGSGGLTQTQKAAFWLLLTSNCYIAASSFLLSAAFLMVGTVAIGLFWSSGRIPWIYLTLVLSVFSFLNVGKVVMRERYWGEAGADAIPEFTLAEMPDRYTEWFQASYDSVVGSNLKDAGMMNAPAVSEGHQTLLQRINNMQNLLFVIDAVETHHIEPLHGKTYTIIPLLLTPRILWPEKPGTHEGQVMLNVHFFRQDLLSTTTTYVAWGLLPEAYGNFGPIAGALILGAALGLVFAWIERHTANKLVISVEGFVCFTIFLGMANSFELVASVLVTSIEQSIIPILLATLPFAQRTVLAKATPSAE